MSRVALLLFLALLTVLRAEEAAGVTRQWIILLRNEPAGVCLETVTPLPGGGTRTREEMRLKFVRLGKELTVSSTSDIEENAEGEFVAADILSVAASEPTRTRVRLEENALVISTEAAGRTYERKTPVGATAKVLGPRGVDALCARELKAEGDHAIYSEFIAEGPAVISTFRSLRRRVGDTLEVQEMDLPATPRAQLVLAKDGRWLRRSIKVGFGELSMVPATPEAAALAEALGAGAEMFERLVVHSHIRLPDPRSLSRLKLRITLRNQDGELPEFPRERQTVTALTDQSCLLQTLRAEPGVRTLPPTDEFLKPNALIQSDDPEIVRLTREATAGLRAAGAKSRALKDWVNRELKVDFGVGLANASEVVRNRRGSCLAAAVLLAAMHRSAGMPSRVVVGYAYHAGSWGGHAWTEVYHTGRWFSLDAALYAPGEADAARICLGTSSGEDGLSEALTDSMGLLGRIDIRVEEFVWNGRRVRVPASAVPARVRPDSYESEWLGFRLRAPKGFVVEVPKAEFLDPTVLLLRSERGTTVRVEQGQAGAQAEPAGQPARLGGRAGTVNFAEDSAKLSVRRGQERWTLTAKGPGAAEAMRATLAGWTWR